MKFEAKDGEETYTVNVFDGEIEFGCNLLEKQYKSLEALLAAVKAKRLELRKNFSNASAVLLDRWNKGIIPVTVTSLDGDEYAWIKRGDGGRTKERRANLYESDGQVRLTMLIEKDLKSQIEAAWEACERWEPKP